MSMMCKINKSEILGGPLSFFDALFGRCTAFYGHFLVDVVTPEGSTCISSSVACLAESAGSPAFGVGLFAWRSRGVSHLVWGCLLGRVVEGGGVTCGLCPKSRA